MAYTRYTGDLYWKRAKSDGTSANGTPYRKGERVSTLDRPARCGPVASAPAPPSGGRERRGD